MIKLSLPSYDKGVYAEIHGGLVRLPPKGTSLQTIGQTEIVYRSSWDRLVQGRGRWHENDVLHDEVHADLSYDPLVFDLTPSPTSMLPDRVTFHHFKTDGITPGTSTFIDGFVQPYSTSRMYSAYTQMYRAWAFGVEEIIQYEVTVGKSFPYNIQSGLTKRRLRIIKRTSTSIEYTLESSTKSVPPVKMSSDPTYLEITGHFTGFSGTWSSPSRKTSTLMYGFTPSSLHVSKVKKDIDVLVALRLALKNHPLREEHYGELAHKAAESVNSNNVNMIAFLKDLRKPWELVPKLRNLRNLRNLPANASDNYLLVKYGWLPTIDDVKSIIGSVKKVKPYLDRNGYEVYTSSHKDSNTINGVDWELEQRIKLAIDDDDVGLAALANKLDDTGFLPTLENIWDLVPYSFVVDWFTDVGDVLERIDGRQRLLRLGIRYTTSSKKLTGRIKVDPSPSLPLSGSVELVQYHRWTSGSCPVPPLIASKPSQPFNHWLESAALILQRKKVK